MAYIVEKHEEKMIDAISDPALWIKLNPAYRGMFERIADTRSGHIERGTSIQNHDFKKIASIPSTLYDVLKLTMSSDGYHLDKHKFRAWLERNPQYKSDMADVNAVAGGF